MIFLSHPTGKAKVRPAAEALAAGDLLGAAYRRRLFAVVRAQISGAQV